MPDPMPDAEVAELIRTARFTPVRFRHGYDMGQVDDFLDRAAREVEAGNGVQHLIEDCTFEQVRFREGYDMGEVDDLLARVLQLTAR